MTLTKPKTDKERKELAALKAHQASRREHEAAAARVNHHAEQLKDAELEKVEVANERAESKVALEGLLYEA